MSTVSPAVRCTMSVFWSDNTAQNINYLNTVTNYKLFFRFLHRSTGLPHLNEKSQVVRLKTDGLVREPLRKLEVLRLAALAGGHVNQNVLVGLLQVVGSPDGFVQIVSCPENIRNKTLNDVVPPSNIRNPSADMVTSNWIKSKDGEMRTLINELQVLQGRWYAPAGPCCLSSVAEASPWILRGFLPAGDVPIRGTSPGGSYTCY